MDMADAGRVLNCSSFSEERGWITNEHELSLLAAAGNAQSTALGEPCFTSHDALVLPDGNSTFKTTRVHHFTLNHDEAIEINRGLTLAAKEQRAASGGIQMSIVGVDGWRGQEEPFEDLKGDRWYSTIRDVLEAALRQIRSTEAAASDRPGAMGGWINSSGPSAFNALHDHGPDVLWSFVYMVASGEPSTASEAAASNTVRDRPTRISQQYFDDVVAENRTMFRLDALEAAAAAVKQLSAQGVNDGHLQLRLLRNFLEPQSMDSEASGAWLHEHAGEQDGKHVQQLSRLAPRAAQSSVAA